MSQLIFTGKVTFSDLAPGLNDAAQHLQEKTSEVEEFLKDKQHHVNSMQKRVDAIQAELERATEAANLAEGILNSANQILQEAKSLTGQLAEALSDSGIYHFNYVGGVSQFGSAVTLPNLNNAIITKEGNSDNTFDSNEHIAAAIVILGSDGGIVNTGNRIARLFQQIGGNGEAIAKLYDPSRE